MLTEENLRFIDENTFQEADPPEDRSRPLEWRRSFNTISFEAESPTVEYSYTVNDIDHFSTVDREQHSDAKPLVTGAARRRVRISLELPQDKLRDCVLFAQETKKGSAVYQLRRPQGPIHVSLAEADPTEPRGPYEQGAFPGLAFRTEFENKSDVLCIEVGVPSQQIEEIARFLRSGDANALHVTLGLQSFSYEVDDALREWYHPRDLFIHGSAAQAVLLSLRLLRNRPKLELPADADSAEGENVPSTAPEVAQPHHPPMPDYSSTLKGIRTALWVVAGIMLLGLMK